MNRILETEVANHYHKPNLMDEIIIGLEAAGTNPESPTPDDLAPVDEFHTAGREGTLLALDKMPITPGMHVLDAGCGIGGTARFLAEKKKCRVTGIDLTTSFIDVANALSERTGYSDDCNFLVGSVLDLPFENGSFDGAISFHVAMNIEDRNKFYSELGRVLKPGASLCIFDVMKGPENGLDYPVPWAENEASSFLKTPIETAKFLEQEGFQIVVQQSLLEFATRYFQELFARANQQDKPAPLGLYLLTGANTAEKFQNYAKGLENHQIDPTIMIAKLI